MNRFFILICVMLILFIQCTSSQGILGVSPGNYLYEDVLRGGYAERSFLITFSGENSVEASIQPIGEIASWINLSTNKSLVSKSSPLRFIAAIEPPSDMPNGNYTGILRIRTSQVSSKNTTGKATGNIIASLDVSITVQVTDREIVKCQSTNFIANSAEKGDDLEFKMHFANQGNIRLKPRVSVDLWDQEQISIVKSNEFIGKEILPTREEDISFYMPTDDLDIGQYWVEMHSLDCLDSQLLTVDVLEPGALKSQGIFKEIIALPVVPVKETTEIITIFENTGEKTVDAQFRGQITLNGKIVQILESEKTSVRVGELANFSFFFTPKKIGDHIIDGRFFYDKKRTFEASKLMSVRSNGLSFRSVIMFIIYLAIVITALYLYLKIRKEIKMRGRFR